MPTGCVCINCGNAFETFPAEIRKGGGKFCSQNCYHKWISENKTKSGKKSNFWKGGKVERKCKYCGVSYYTYPSQIKWRGSNFCSKDHRINFYKMDNHWAYNDYSSRKPYCKLWSPEFRENVRAFFGYICVECKKTQEENGQKLVVHHVNYLKDALCKEGEHVKDRLFVPLCRSCHGKTNPKSRREFYKTKYTALIMNEYQGLCYTTEGCRQDE